MYRSCPDTRTAKQWTALLSTSSRFRLQKLRALSIEALEKLPAPLDPIERVVLAARFDVPQWLAHAYTELVIREQPLSGAEARRVGHLVAFWLARARENFLTGTCLLAIRGLG